MKFSLVFILMSKGINDFKSNFVEEQIYQLGWKELEFWVPVTNALSLTHSHKHTNKWTCYTVYIKVLWVETIYPKYKLGTEVNVQDNIYSNGAVDASRAALSTYSVWLRIRNNNKKPDSRYTASNLYNMDSTSSPTYPACKKKVLAVSIGQHGIENIIHKCNHGKNLYQMERNSNQALLITLSTVEISPRILPTLAAINMC